MKAIIVMFAILVGPGVVLAQEGIYQLGPDSLRHAEVPRGEIVQHRWDTSEVYANTWRDWWCQPTRPPRCEGRPTS